MFNLTLLVVLAAVPIMSLLVTRRPDWGDLRAHEVSVRARLPFGNETTRTSVRRRARGILRTNMWALLVAIVAMGPVFALTPLGRTPFALWLLTDLILIVVLTTGTVVAQVRERLLAPAPDAPRIARVSPLGVADYVGPWRRRLPFALLAAGAAATTALAMATAIRGGDDVSLVPAVAALGFAAAVTTITRVLEVRVLARPQPASDTLALAWDDLFRADALGTLRMSSAVASWLPFGLAATGLVSLWTPEPRAAFASLLSGFPWWGIPALQITYTVGGVGRLPVPLYPAWLQRPALAGDAS